MNKSNSYPERLCDEKGRIQRDTEKKLDLYIQTVDDFKRKDHIRTQRLADIGSPSSSITTQKSLFVRIVDFLLEREEKTRREDEYIRQKSYSGFYYFIKWLVRSLFFLVFTTLGTIAGKETGCAIKEHKQCENGVINLVNSSPHIIASVVGCIFGLILGQWIGRFLWDKGTKSIRNCLRRIEKWADRTKFFLLLFSFFVYIVVICSFSVVFWLFVDLGQDKENILGGGVGMILGLILAVMAYRKSSSCQTGQQTPMIHGNDILDTDISEIVI